MTCIPIQTVSLQPLIQCKCIALHMPCIGSRGYKYMAGPLRFLAGGRSRHIKLVCFVSWGKLLFVLLVLMHVVFCFLIFCCQYQCS